MDFAVNSEDSLKATRLLQAYCASIKASYVVLCHRSGSVLAEAGSLAGDASPLALLSGSSFDSANQFAAMMGAGHFKAVSFLNDSNSVFITAIEPSLLFIQIFPGRLPAKIEDFSKLLIDKLNAAVPAFVQEANGMIG